jgi:hypothetical protein
MPMHQTETEEQQEEQQKDTPNRDARGYFLPGHRIAGPGNPNIKRVHQLRTMMIHSVEDGDFLAVFKKLVEMAKDGDIQAIKEFNDRILGKPKQDLDLGEDVAVRRIVIEVEAPKAPKALE